MTTQRRSIGSRRIPLHDHVDLNSGGKLSVSQALRGGIETIQSVVSPPAGLDAGLAALRAVVNGYQAHGSMGATETFDSATGWHSGTLDANCTFTLTAAASGTVSSLFLELTQDGTGGRTITLPASVTNKADLEADQDTTLSTTSFLVLLSRDGGTTWVGGWWGQGGSALTVENEGTPLATDATTLDFVGAGVTASGAGAEKTITIPGATASDIAAMGFVGPVVIASVHSSPLVFDDLVQDSEGNELVYPSIP